MVGWRCSQKYFIIKSIEYSILEIKESQEKNINKFKDALTEFIRFIDEKQSKEHLSNMVQTSFENVFKGIEEGSTISEDDYIRLIDNLSEKFAHFLDFKNKSFQDTKEETLE